MSKGADDAQRRSGPSVGVIMAARDASTTVAASVRSVLAQSVPAEQIVVVDDGSRDDTAAILEAISGENERLTVVRSAHIGRAAARNLAIERLTTDLVAVQDADDIALPWRFEEALATFEANPGAVAVGAQMLGFHRDGYAWELPRWPTEPDAIAATFARGAMAVAHPTAVMRRDVVVAAGGYDASYAYAEDLTLFLQLNAKGRIASSSRNVTLYRRPVRQSLSHLYKSELAMRQAHLQRGGEQTPSGVGVRLGSLVTAERGWLRQRLKRLVHEQPLSEFGVTPADTGGAP